METYRSLETWISNHLSHLTIPRKGMETSIAGCSYFKYIKSHLTIPRKGMETHDTFPSNEYNKSRT